MNLYVLTDINKIYINVCLLCTHIHTLYIYVQVYIHIHKQTNQQHIKTNKTSEVKGKVCTRTM